MATKTKTNPSLKRAGKARDPKFTAIEKAIIADATNGSGWTKAAAIAWLRKLENAGADPNVIAAGLRYDEIHEGRQATKALGKEQPGDEAAYQQISDLMNQINSTLSPDSPEASEADVDALMEALGGFDDADDDDDPR